MTIVTLGLIGDVMLGRLVNDQIPDRPPGSFWGDTLPILREADAVIANLECAISTDGRAWSRAPKAFHFRADPAAVGVLRAGNIRCVSLANNHSLDFETEGLVDTLAHLDEAGILHAGAGRTLEEAMAPALLRLPGVTVGVIALTDNEPAFVARHNRPGTWYTEIRSTGDVLAPIEERVRSLREQGADLVVLSVHWGPNMVERPPVRFRSFARDVIDRGVDVLHGHSAHIFQAVERHRNGLILYSTGDILDDYAVDPRLHNDWSFIFLVEADGAGLRRLRLVPVQLHLARVDRADGETFEAIRRRMEDLCTEFGTPLGRTVEGLELVLRP